MEYEEEFKAAVDAAKDSGKEILRIYASQEHHIRTKVDSRDYESPLTQADLAANKIILERLEVFGFDALSEESKDDKTRVAKEHVWIIDPLDGTKEFISGNGEFTVNIALCKKGKPLFGVVYAPVKGIMYTGHKDEGSYAERMGERERISVSNRKIELIIAKSRSHPSERLQALLQDLSPKGTITSGSSIKGCLVAEGIADLYPRLGPVNEWDICAMHAVVENAGGKMTLLDGKDIVYNNKDTLLQGFVASNSMIHDDIIKKIGELR